MRTVDDVLPTLQVPENVRQILNSFVQAAHAAFGEDLQSIILYGSAAEGRMRATSDVNVVLVLARFSPAAAERLSGPLRLAEAAVRLRAMFLRADEVPAATVAFALKFTDLAERHVVLQGHDFFSELAIPREAKLHRLRQVLLNALLRMRESLVLLAGQEERLVHLIAESAGPLRSAAVTLLELENAPPAPNPKAALEKVAAETGADGYRDVLALLSTARTDARLAPGAAGPAFTRLLELAEALHLRASRLGPAATQSA
ncbi:MAG: nucleotidyltransferase domain-containing protein [Verrucomicrobia bacterium]|nr:nucleotidyltransferase domain-containing protein [Verrucomicrobiota bacterium]